ncbi:MAG: PAC2 family protein [Actinobacteria bacterium HGW-Actinobacteria-2]|nr:MAG: PAC2 family protein [Actinobacteria bacterium HGW-Actinobacteria-2]
MLDPRELYQVDADVAASISGLRPSLIHLFDGYVDAGTVNHSASKYLLEVCEHRVLARFDHDQLHDYRSRRPQMVFDTNHWVELIDYSLLVHLLTDANGKKFLLLTGPEPDTQWNRASAAVLLLANELGVSQLLTCNGVPMAVPHTRPTLVTSHATDPSLATGNPMWIDRVQLPGSFSHVLEYRAGEAGMLGQGFVANVPHYLAQAAFPQATAAVISRIATAAGLEIPLDLLHARAQANLAEIAAETASDAEFVPMVAALEEQYDQLAANGGASVPSAEEIGAAVEQFLAEQDPPTDFGA